MKIPMKLFIVVLFLASFVLPATAADEATPTQGNLPSIGNILKVIDKATSPENMDKETTQWSGSIKLVIVFAALAIIPSLLIMMTSFTRIVIVLSFVRRALGTQTIPPNMAIVGLALFLTIFTMAPTFKQINTDSIAPYLAQEIDFNQALEKSSLHMKEFMLRQTRTDDIKLFMKMSKTEPPEKPIDLGLEIITPSFIISEFRTAFEIGCLLFIPFLLIDLVIAGILLSAGMMMLPPVMISLPFKLILFILVDGWGLLAKSLSLSFH